MAKSKKKSLVGYLRKYNLETFAYNRYYSYSKERGHRNTRIHVPVIYGKKINPHFIKVEITIKEVA